MLNSDRGRLGVLAEQAHELRQLEVAELLVPPGAPDLRSEYLLGVTRDALIVIDAGRLLADPQLVVDQTAA